MSARPEPRLAVVPPPPAPPAPPALRDQIGIAVVLLGALALRLWHLGARSLWTDEGSSWTAATSTLGTLVRLCAQKDASPPLFYLLTWVSMKLGGDEAHLRFVSVLASLGLVWLTYRFMRLVAGRGVSTLAAALTALSPYQLMFAQEARTYTLVGCFAGWSLYLFVRAVLFDRPRAWLPFIFVTALGLYTQSIAALGIGVQAAIILFTRAGRRQALPWVISLVVASILYLPWMVISFVQMSRLSHSHWYLKPPTDHGLFQVVRSVLLTPIPVVTAPHGSPVPGLEAWLPRKIAQLALVAIPALPLAWSLRAVFARGVTGSFVRAMWMALVLPLAAVYVVSFKMPLWLPRYFVFLTPFLSVLLAYGLATLRPRAIAAASGALVLLISAFACVRYDLDYTKEPWRDAVRDIAVASTSGRAAVLVPFDVDPFRFYNIRLERPLDAYEVSHPAVPFASSYTREELDWMERRAADQTARYDEVWVVVRSPNSDVRRELAARTERVAARGRVEVERWRLDSMGGPLRIAHYRTPATPPSPRASAASRP